MIKIFFVTLMAGLMAYPMSQNIGSIEMTDCFLEDCSGEADHPNVEFGFLAIPEDYSDPAGRQIKIAFAIIKGQEADLKSDPIILFTGGWGVSSLETLFSTAEKFPVKNRDLILYDYRGTGYSEPALCPNLGEKLWDVLKADLSYREFFDHVNALSYNCLEQIENGDIDYRQYGTTVKTKDAVILAENLGYEQINLFGISNGTMGIQGFLKAAAGMPVKVRSILSDSNVPIASFNRARITSDYKRVLDSILSDCENQPSCKEVFPNLKERFYSFLKDPSFTPVSYRGDTGFVFNKYEINSLIHQLLYASQTHKDIPMLLEAIMDGRMDFLSQLYLPLKERVSVLNGTSIINYEYDWKFTQETIRKTYRESHSQIAEFALADFWIDFALNDSTLMYSPADTVVVRSEAPALVLAGTYDPITPPGLSEIMHQRYVNSYFFVLPRIGHGAIGEPCGKELYLQFLENPGVRPESECVQQLTETEIPFTTSYIPNQKASGLLVGILQHQDSLLILAVAVPFLISLILLVRELVNQVRQTMNVLVLALSCSNLIFIVALGVYLYQTVSQGGLFILFGITGEAVWLPCMALLIAILALAVFVKTLQNRQNVLLNSASLLSVALIMWLSIRFELFLF